MRGITRYRTNSAILANIPLNNNNTKNLKSTESQVNLVIVIEPSDRSQSASVGVDLVDGFDNDSVVVGSVQPNSPAERRGLRVGQRIFAINGLRATNARQSNALIRTELGQLRFLLDQKEEEGRNFAKSETFGKTENEMPLQSGHTVHRGVSFLEPQFYLSTRSLKRFQDKNYDYVEAQASCFPYPSTFSVVPHLDSRKQSIQNEILANFSTEDLTQDWTYPIDGCLDQRLQHDSLRLFYKDQVANQGDEEGRYREKEEEQMQHLDDNMNERFSFYEQPNIAHYRTNEIEELELARIESNNNNNLNFAPLFYPLASTTNTITSMQHQQQQQPIPSVLSASRLRAEPSSSVSLVQSPGSGLQAQAQAITSPRRVLLLDQSSRAGQIISGDISGDIQDQVEASYLEQRDSNWINEVRQQQQQLPRDSFVIGNYQQQAQSFNRSGQCRVPAFDQFISSLPDRRSETADQILPSDPSYHQTGSQPCLSHQTVRWPTEATSGWYENEIRAERSSARSNQNNHNQRQRLQWLEQPELENNKFMGSFEAEMTHQRRGPQMMMMRPSLGDQRAQSCSLTNVNARDRQTRVSHRASSRQRTCNQNFLLANPTTYFGPSNDAVFTNSNNCTIYGQQTFATPIKSTWRSGQGSSKSKPYYQLHDYNQCDDSFCSLCQTKEQNESLDETAYDDSPISMMPNELQGLMPPEVAKQMQEQASNFVRRSRLEGPKAIFSSNDPNSVSQYGQSLQVRRTLKVKIKKSKPILGIAIEGGFNVSGQLLPRVLFVHEDGAAYQCGKLRANDLILEVNGQSTANMTHKEIADTIASAYYHDPCPYIEFLVGESIVV